MKRMTVSITFMLLFLSLTVSCSRENNNISASGIFEANETVVSAEGSGRILSFTAREGMRVREGEVLGEIDSRQLLLRKNQLLASAAALASRMTDPEVQTAPLEQQISSALTEQVRIENLLKANAANQKALDDIHARIALLRTQLAAQKSSIRSGNSAIEHERQALLFQIDQLDDQIAKCSITAPESGTVLISYAAKGESAAPGKALFKLADLEEMIFRAYITSGQLSALRLGQKVTVLADFASRGDIPYEGTVSWIADEAEFTPKTIQTSEERENLVYAVKVRVPNDGYLKIGMYGSMTVGN